MSIDTTTYYKGKIYAVKGGNTKEFWCYLPENNEWVYVNEVGTGSATLPAKGIKCGKSLTASETGIYCLIGNKTNEFWFYDGRETEAKSLKPTVMANSIPTREFTLTIAPNPSFGKVTIRYNAPIKTTAYIVIHNVLGEIIYSTKTDRDSFTIEKLPAGVYFVSLAVNNYKTNRKMVVTR